MQNAHPYPRARGCHSLPLYQGVVEVNEGIVVQEGAYVVRYFLGGSNCCVAESEIFKVSGRTTSVKSDPNWHSEDMERRAALRHRSESDPNVGTVANTWESIIMEQRRA